MIYWSFNVASAVMWFSTVLYPAFFNQLLKYYGVRDSIRIGVGIAFAIGLAVTLLPTINFIGDIHCRHFHNVPCNEVERQLP